MLQVTSFFDYLLFITENGGFHIGAWSNPSSSLQSAMDV